MTAQVSGGDGMRTYGGWRRARGIGLFGLSAGATFVVLLCAVAVLVAATFSLLAGAIVAVPAGLVVALTTARWDGVPITHLAARRVRWWWARSRGYHRLRAGVLVEHPRAFELPGPLAPTEMVEAVDGRGVPYGLVWDRRTGMLTATLECAAASTWLVETDEADGWVANWHEWMAGLGHVPMVHHVTVTVATAPEPGASLATHIGRRLAPDAPDDAVAFMRELVEASPRAAAAIRTWVAITFDPSRAAERLTEVVDQAAEISLLLDGFATSLAGCGVTVLGRASPASLAAVVRGAFDPAAGAVTRDVGAEDTAFVWEESGPVAAEEAWDHYRHDSGTSTSWAWREAPRQQVTSQVLTRLLAPGRHPKRITMVYRPLTAGDAARVLEGQVNAAQFREQYRRAQGRDETARDRTDREQAQQAAGEEASGAGVVRMSMYATVTVLDAADLPAAVADVEARAEAGRIRLRRLFGGQMAGFAATLPLGLYPPELAARQLR